MTPLPPVRLDTISDQRVDRVFLDALLMESDAPRRFEHCFFDGEDLEALDLRGLEFVSCSFVGTRLDRAELSSTRWSRSRCAGASFDFADLTDARFDQGDLNNTSWRRTRLSGAAFVDVKLTGARFIEVQSLGLSFKTSLLVSADLRGISFRKQTLDGLNLTGADLAGCDFTEAVLVDCDLTNASLKNARFSGADLRRATLGAVQVGDLAHHYKGSIISAEQASSLVAALGVQVI